MWTQPYAPIGGSLTLSALVAALPLAAVGCALALWRMTSWKASLLGACAALAVSVLAYGMPLALALSAAVYGMAFGLFQLGLIVYAAILLFDLVVDSGRFDGIRTSLMSVSSDKRIQVLVVAFAFGAFLEGAAGAGTPVAVCAALLVAVGFTPIRASAMSLLANTAPVAFGALGLPIVTLAAVTGLPMDALSAAVGRICPMIGLIVPAYLIAANDGWRSAIHVWPALVVSGAVFATVQFIVSNTIGPHLADIISALATLATMVALLRFWQPSGQPSTTEHGNQSAIPGVRDASVNRGVASAWLPYLCLVVVVLVWGAGPTQRLLNATTWAIPVPALHLAVLRMPPVVPAPDRYPAIFTFSWLSGAGTACLVAAIVSAIACRIPPRRFLGLAASTARKVALPELTIALVVAIAFVMNYAGATGTLGIAVASTQGGLPFCSAFLGWLGVFLTGSDTSSNALFGPLQVASAERLHLNPVLLAAVNTCGGVMGKMVSVQSIAIAAAATGMRSDEEGRLFRSTLKHSLALTAIVGGIATLYAYGMPAWMPVVR